MDTADESLVERAWGNLARGFREIATGAARSLGLSDQRIGQDRHGLRSAMQGCLDARGGDVAARMKAAELGAAYSQADQAGRALFLSVLAEDFAADPQAIAAAIATWQEAAPETREEAEEGLRHALQAPRIKLITQFLSLPAGVKFLVDLRSDLLNVAGQDKALRGLDRDLRGLLESWFDVGFLDVRRISWESPASLLEKIVAYEAVHQIRSWTDLRNRLESDRRLYGLFHPRMPEEPLAFVEVALTTTMADSVQALLDVKAPLVDANKAEAAIFYSISNTQAGLSGIAFGEWLIKMVVQRLSQEFPELETFATLSPLPGFAKWLAGEEGRDAVLAQPEGEKARLLSLLEEPAPLPEALEGIFVKPRWWGDGALAEAMQPLLTRLCLAYLLSRRADGQPLDPVARFHLRNGARLERINWLGDVSKKGIRNARGLMVNYLYDPAMIDANHEAYRREGRVVLGSDMRGLARQLRHAGLPQQPSLETAKR